MRLIDAELLKNTMERLIKEEAECYNTSPQSWEKEIENFKTLIDSMPVIDAEPVVRCKDCAFRNTEDCAMYYEDESDDCPYSWCCANDFCSWGKKVEK